jgi:hypothetical protein
MLPDEYLACLEYLAHAGALKVLKCQAATGVAILSFRPLAPCVLDVRIDPIIELVARSFDLRLQSYAAADHIVDDDCASALCKT